MWDQGKKEGDKERYVHRKRAGKRLGIHRPVRSYVPKLDQRGSRERGIMNSRDIGNRGGRKIDRTFPYFRLHHSRIVFKKRRKKNGIVRVIALGDPNRSTIEKNAARYRLMNRQKTPPKNLFTDGEREGRGTEMVYLKKDMEHAYQGRVSQFLVGDEGQLRNQNGVSKISVGGDKTFEQSWEDQHKRRLNWSPMEMNPGEPSIM